MNQTVGLDLGVVLQAVDEAGLFSATCTIKRFNGTLGPTGVEDKQDAANWADLTNHVNIPCMDARDIQMTNISRSKEVKGPEAFETINLRHTLLSGCFPLILQNDRAVITSKNGVVATLDIDGIEPDSQAIMTRLQLKDLSL